MGPTANGFAQRLWDAGTNPPGRLGLVTDRRVEFYEMLVWIPKYHDLRVPGHLNRGFPHPIVRLVVGPQPLIGGIDIVRLKFNLHAPIFAPDGSTTLDVLVVTRYSEKRECAARGIEGRIVVTVPGRLLLEECRIEVGEPPDPVGEDNSAGKLHGRVETCGRT